MTLSKPTEMKIALLQNCAGMDGPLRIFQSKYRVFRQLADLGWIDIWDVLPYCPVAQPILPKSHLPKQNKAHSGTAKIKVNPTKVKTCYETFYSTCRPRLYSAGNVLDWMIHQSHPSLGRRAPEAAAPRLLPGPIRRRRRCRRRLPSRFRTCRPPRRRRRGIFIIRGVMIPFFARIGIINIRFWNRFRELESIPVQ